MKSFTNTVETMKSDSKQSSGSSGLSALGQSLQSASTNESATAASSMTGMSLSAKSSMSASFLSASQFKSVLLVTKTIATLFLIWVVYKLLTMTQNGSGKRPSIPQIMMGGGKPVVVSLDYDDFTE
jgi:hypothetical protein